MTDWSHLTEEELRAIAAGQPVAPTPAPTPAPNNGDTENGSFLDPLVGQGVLFGAGDEAKAAARSLAGGSYDTELQNARSDQEAYAKRHPYLTPALEGAGMAATMALPVGRALAGGAGMVRAGIGAATGGGLFGFNSGEGGVANRVMEAGKNALISGPIGMVAGPMGSFLGKGIGYLAGRYSPATVPSALKPLARAFESDAVSPADVQALGPQGMLLDAGPNMKQQALTLARSPGEAQQTVRGALLNRDLGASGRATVATNAALGQAPNVPKTVMQIAAARDAQAAPMYAKAYAVPVQPTKPIVDALNTPAGQRAMKTAQELAANEGKPLTAVDTRALDYIKRALDDQIAAAEGKGLNEQVRAITIMKNGMLAEIDKQNPAYAQARKIYAGPTTVMKAYEDGSRVFNNSVSPDQFKIDLAGMSQAERDAYLQSARAQVAKIMGTARNDAGAAAREFDKGWNQDKLRIMVGDQKANEMLAKLKAEQRFAGSSDRIRNNSVTSEALAGMEGLRIGTAINKGKDAFVYGGWSGPLRHGIVSGADKLIDLFMAGRAGARSNAIAQALTATGPERDALVSALMQRRNNLALGSARSQAAQNLIRALAQRGGVSLSPLAGNEFR